MAYEALFVALRDSHANFRPRLAITDFEAAEINAWMVVFQIEVQGCYWHYTRVSMHAFETSLQKLLCQTVLYPF